MISERDGDTHLELTQHNAGDEQTATHSQQMWSSMLSGLKQTVEAG